MSEEKKVYAPIKITDYRVIRPLAFLEKGGKHVISVQQLSTFEINGCKVSFITPNSVTMFYNKSWKEFEKGREIYNEVIKSKLKTGSSFDVKDGHLTKLYDYFEHIQTSIITIYSAIEALCNVAIPEKFTLTKKNNKGVTEVWDKANIEKWISTEEKADKIVPDILNVESPKMLPLWERFKGLKEVRDNIIHQKQSVNKPNEVESGFLLTLLDDSIVGKIMAGFELIQYFCSKDQTHTYFPLLGDETPVTVNFVDNFAGTFTFGNEKLKVEINKLIGDSK